MVTACIPLIQFLASWAYYFSVSAHQPRWLAAREMAIIVWEYLTHNAANVCY